VKDRTGSGSGVEGTAQVRHLDRGLHLALVRDNPRLSSYSKGKFEALLMRLK
jgi:hypothetical protein